LRKPAGGRTIWPISRENRPVFTGR